MSENLPAAAGAEPQPAAKKSPGLKASNNPGSIRWPKGHRFHHGRAHGGASVSKRNPVSWLFTTHHRMIGIQYLLLSLVAVAAGTILSLVMRIHLVWPDLAIPFFGQVKPEDYLALVTMHGTLMVFFVLTTAPLSASPTSCCPNKLARAKWPCRR